MSHVKRLEIGGVCLKGHELTGDAIYWREKRGSKYIACLPCKRERAKRSYEKNKPIRVRNREAEYRARGMGQSDARLLKRIIADEAEGDMAHKNDERPSSPWNYEAKKVSEGSYEFNKATDAEHNVRPKCFGDTSYADYDDPNEKDPDFLIGVPAPTRREAEAMCAGCPFYIQCDGWANSPKKPSHGVYAGKVFAGGKKLY